MDLYRRIAQIRSEEDGDDLVDELVDRYGDPPRSVNNLITVALLRAQAAECGITDITQTDKLVHMTLKEYDPNAIVAVDRMPAFKNRLTFKEGPPPVLTLKLGKNEDVLRALRQMLKAYSGEIRKDIAGKQSTSSVQNR